MATKKKKSGQEPLYRYSPQYGFIPADSNSYPNDTNTFAQNPYNLNEQNNVPPYSYNPHYNAYGPMHQHHMMQLQTMQAQIQQMQQSMQNPQANQFSNQANALTPEKMQEIYAIIGDVAEGRAQPDKLLSLMQNVSSDFWKGLALGAGAILIYNYTPLKDMLSSLLTNFMPTNASSQDNNLDEDGFEKEEE